MELRHGTLEKSSRARTLVPMTWCTAMILVAAGAGLAHAQAQPPAVPVDVAAELHDGAHAELRFIVKSNSDEPMRYFVDGLPWRCLLYTSDAADE